jgi:hypothetical protein
MAQGPKGRNFKLYKALPGFLKRHDPTLGPDDSFLKRHYRRKEKIGLLLSRTRAFSENFVDQYIFARV